MGSILRKGVGTAALAVVLMNPVRLRAQNMPEPAPVPQTSTEQSTSKGENMMRMNIFDTAQYIDSAITAQLATKTTINLGGDKMLWVVGGKQDKINSEGADASGYDAGLKLVFGKGKDASWIRGTALNDTNNQFSYGADLDLRLFSVSRMTVSLLGDINSMDLSTDIARHMNYGTGLNFNLGNGQNVFGMINSKGIQESVVEVVGGNKKTVKMEENTDGYRIGYVYTNYTDRLAALFVEGQNTKKLVYSTFLSWNRLRLMGSYDPNLKIGWTQTYLTFGMGKLTDRTLTSQVLDQFVYAERADLVNGGLLDSDNTVRASTPPVWLGTTSRPAKSVGEFVKFSCKVNPKDTRHNDFDLYGVTVTRKGLLLTENITKDTLGTMHYGGGVGYKFWKWRFAPTPVFVLQTNRSIQGSLVYTFER